MRTVLSMNLKKLHPDAVVPEFKTDGAAGFDFVVVESAILKPPSVARRVETSSKTLMPNIISYPTFHPVVLRTGLAIELPEGYELEVRSRSGLGFKHDVLAFNGTIDADYRGEIMLKVWNLGTEPFYVEKGMRMAQGVIKKVYQAFFNVVDELGATDRGDKGFSSTGI